MSERRSQVVWATYATEAAALRAMNTERFGIASWSVEHRPEREPEPWCLIDNRTEAKEWPDG